MSPTVFTVGTDRFYFFSREEERIHIHIKGERGVAKFWIEPIIALAEHKGYNERDLKRLQKIVEDEKHAIIKAWKKHKKQGM